MYHKLTQSSAVYYLSVQVRLWCILFSLRSDVDQTLKRNSPRGRLPVHGLSFGFRHQAGITMQRTKDHQVNYSPCVCRKFSVKNGAQIVHTGNGFSDFQGLRGVIVRPSTAPPSAFRRAKRELDPFFVRSGLFPTKGPKSFITVTGRTLFSARRKMRTDLRRHLQMHVERHGIQWKPLNRQASAIAAAHSRERMVRDITAKQFAELHRAESATWQEGVKEHFQ